MKFLVDFLKFFVQIVPSLVELISSTEKRKAEKRKKQEDEKDNLNT